MNKNIYLQGIMLLAKIFPNYKIDTELFYELLKDIPDKAFQTAITNITNNVKELYPNTNIIALIREYTEGNKDDKALIAWNLAKKAVQDIGYYNTPDFADPIISHCLNELGGWMEFCSAKIEDLPFIEKRFMDLYRLFLKREVFNPIKLYGFFAVSNTEKGYLDKIPEPIKIGYEKKNKQLVLENKL